METSKTGSKPDLNESHIPLLEEDGKGDHPDKEEKIEMENKNETEKEDKATDEKKDEESDKKDKKKKKEKKPKEKKDPSSPKKTPLTCAQNCTIGLNVFDRDEKHINDHVNINFEDIIAETDSLQGFEFIWRITYLLFTSSRTWFYGLITAFVAPILAIFWALVFALITAVMVWILMPIFKLFEIVLHYGHKYWNAVVRCLLDPVFGSAGLLFANIRTKTENHNHAHTV